MAGSHLNFQDVVTLHFNKNGKRAKFDTNWKVKIDGTQGQELEPWQRFLLLNPANLSSSDRIQYGQEVVLLSYQNKYVTGDANGDVLAWIDTIGTQERWKFYKYNDATITGDIPLVGAMSPVGYIFIRSHSGKVLLPDSNNFAKATQQNYDNTLNVQSNQTCVVIRPVNVWSFYYDKPIPSFDQFGENRCASRGKWDGANCFIGKPHVGLPFIYQNNFYYKIVSSAYATMGHWDGAHGQAGNNKSSDVPFIYDGAFYLKPSNISNCPVGGGAGYGSFKICPQYQSMKITIVPYEPTYNQLGQVIGSSPIALNDIAFYKVEYRKKFTANKVSTPPLVGTNVHTISGLQSGKTYKVWVYYKKKTSSDIREIEPNLEVTII